MILPVDGKVPVTPKYHALTQSIQHQSIDSLKPQPSNWTLLRSVFLSDNVISFDVFMFIFSFFFFFLINKVSHQSPFAVQGLIFFLLVY